MAQKRSWFNPSLDQDALEKSFRENMTQMRRVTNWADMSTESSRLEYFLAEIQNQGAGMGNRPSVLHDLLGGVLSKEAADFGAVGASRHPGIGIDEYYSRFPDAISALRSRPVSSTALQQYFNLPVPAQDNKTIGQLYPELKNIRTVGDIQDTLFKYNTPAMLNLAKQYDGQGGVGADDLVNEMTVGFYQQSIHFNPQASSFQRWATLGMRNSAHDFVRRENQAQKLAGLVTGGGQDDESSYFSGEDNGANGIGEVGDMIVGMGGGAAVMPDVPVNAIDAQQRQIDRWGKYSLNTSGGWAISHLAQNVDPNSPFAKAGGREGDVLLGLRRMVTPDMADQMEAGGSLSFMVARPREFGPDATKYDIMQLAFSGTYAPRRFSENAGEETWYDKVASAMGSNELRTQLWTDEPADVSDKYGWAQAYFDAENPKNSFTGNLSRTRSGKFRYPVVMNHEDVRSIGRIAGALGTDSDPSLAAAVNAVRQLENA
jgi:RNA polymerase sigma factor (sigma-70 family)